MSLATDLLHLHSAEKRAARGAWLVNDRTNYMLLVGRCQGMERAMELIGVEFVAITKETSCPTDG